MTQGELLEYACRTLERLGIEYALVGSLATSVWGEPRFTNDIDIVVRLDVFDAACLCREFPAPAFYVSEAASMEAVDRGGQFNVIHPASANKIDFMVAGASRWSDAQLERRVARELTDSGPCFVAAPEDVILGKLLYYREGGAEKHLRDITGVLLRSSELIDRAYLDRFADELGVGEEWRSIVAWLRERSLL